MNYTFIYFKIYVVQTLRHNLFLHFFKLSKKVTFCDPFFELILFSRCILLLILLTNELFIKVNLELLSFC